MKRMLLVTSLALALSLAAVSALRADHVLVRLGDSLFVIEGRVADPTARIMTVTHEKFRNIPLRLYYRNEDELMHIQELIRTPSRKVQHSKQLATAQKGATPQRLALAEWAVKHGMLPEFHQAIDLTLEGENGNTLAQHIRTLRTSLAEPLPASSEEEKYLTETLGRGMKCKSSAHYIIAYDTPDARAQERLDLLEQVYETFFMYFALKGRVLEKPQKRLMVALFNDYKNYSDFSKGINPELTSAAGYWSPDTNVAVFYAQGTHPDFKVLTDISQTLEKTRKEAERMQIKNRGDLVRLADTIKLLTLVSQENQDIEVVTHEATHQIAGNSGLFPRRIRVPKWVQEGLAAFFEAPYEATWSGIGAVNQQRIDFYRALEGDRVHSNIDFVVSDQIYSRAGSDGAVLHAYGQAWALTHFLVDRHFDKLMDYYRNVARLPADMILSEHTLIECFDAAFGKDRAALDGDWRRHMNGLQTDIDKLRKEYGSRGLE